MNARQIRYNKTILGSKIDPYSFDKSDIQEMAEINDKEKILRFMSTRGCPENINSKAFKNDCYHFDDSCNECWNQVPYDWENWDEEGDDD